MNYQDFLKMKSASIRDKGFEPFDMNEHLFDFQRYAVAKGLNKGRFAYFLDCGMGKTIIQLEISDQCRRKTGKPGLIITPLAVSAQTIQEGHRFGYETGKNGSSIEVWNYEQLSNLDLSKFGSICLDESSILKSFQGKTKKSLIDSFQGYDYRFCFTATPSPNDHMELGNHSEFLGAMKFKNMLSMYFVNDMDTVQKWRLKGHAEGRFWKFVSEWALCATSPCDMGFADDGYVLPELEIVEHSIETEKTDNGLLFNSMNVSSTNHNKELKRTFDERMDMAINLSKGDEPCIVWVKQNVESEYLAKHIEGAKEVTGSMKDSEKEKRLLGFANGDFRVLVTKPKIAQYGLNYQNCSRQVFPSLDFSFEGTYQAIRRSYRYGQKNKVKIHLITTDTMQSVLDAINRKQEQFQQMQQNLKTHAA